MQKIKKYLKANRKALLFFLSGALVALLITGTCLTFYSLKKAEQKQVQLEKKKVALQKKEKAKKKAEKQKKKQEEMEEQKILNEEQTSSSDTTSNSLLEQSTQSPNPSTSNPKTEADVIEYFYEQERYASRGETDPTIPEKLKNGVNTIYQFLFHGGTIYGKTFKELSSSAKLQVLKIAMTIDTKIDNYFPNYKQNIKQKANNLKSKIVITYLETTNQICTNHEDICTQARVDFKTMKNSFKITFSLIAGLVKEGSTALKEWYLSTK